MTAIEQGQSRRAASLYLPLLVLTIVMAGCAHREYAAAPPPPMPAPPPVPVGMAIGEMPRPGLLPGRPEQFSEILPNVIQQVADAPLSTFSIDVDTGGYSLVRDQLDRGSRPRPDSVRTEELVNYFDYGYAGPQGGEHPFAIHTAVAKAPWNSERHLLRIAVQGRKPDREATPPANLVFLIDTSGSMWDPDKLPLAQRTLGVLVRELRPQDRISIVAYAGSAGLVLPPTSGDQHQRILDSLDQLRAGGSTNGGEGIQLAYRTARDAFVRGGSNWVILATDGDFNVGVSGQKELEELISSKRQTGIGLMTLGFGRGNYQEPVAERLANLGNGQYAYIDSLREGRRAMMGALSGSLMTIASDVKIQVEFNPTQVKEYRLVGYENRLLAREDFNNDKVDAGEIGAGQQVTALYELTLSDQRPAVDPLRYGTGAAPQGLHSELAFVKLRYKAPESSVSTLITEPVQMPKATGGGDDAFRMAAAVAAFSELLRNSQYIGNFGYGDVLELLRSVRSPDPRGERAEFERLVEVAEML